MPFFRKKPVIVEAIQWTGQNTDDIRKFVGESSPGECRFLLMSEIFGSMSSPAIIYDDVQRGYVPVNLNDWIIRGVKGEFYPCADNVMRLTYVHVSEYEVALARGTLTKPLTERET